MMPFFLLSVLIAAILAGGYLGFRYACARTADPDWDDPESLAGTMWKDHPVSIPDAGKWLREHNAVDVETTSFDGLKLSGKWVPAEHPMGTIILFHGYRSTYLTDFGGIFNRYHNWGLNLLLVRQRAHGESEGQYITFGVRERMDVLSWIDFHNRTHGMDNVYLGGMSMGASTLLFAAGEALPPNVRGITADCGFSSPAEIIALTAQKRFRIPAKPILPVVNLFSRLLAGFDLWECNSTKILARAKVPILFIHGKADDFVPCRMTQAGYNACSGEKHLVLVEGAGHGMAFLFDRERVVNALRNFFFGHLSPEYQLEETQ